VVLLRRLSARSDIVGMVVSPFVFPALGCSFLIISSKREKFLSTTIYYMPAGPTDKQFYASGTIFFPLPYVTSISKRPLYILFLFWPALPDAVVSITSSN